MRLRRIEDEFVGRVRVEWRSYLLRPRPDPSRTLEKFADYTRSWQRPASEPDSGTFRVWQGDAGPPSHSLPPHLFAKTAATVSEAAFQRVHERLLSAYFAENLDITDAATLRRLWRELELPEPPLAGVDDPTLVQQILREHNEAIELGVSGVPAARIDGREGFVLGAQPIELYHKWLTRLLAEEEASG